MEMSFSFASFQGSLHVRHQVPNQDRVVAFEHNGFLCAIVCDGVSLKSDRTFSNSEIAAAACLMAARSYLQTHLPEQLEMQQGLELLKDCFEAAWLALKIEVGCRGIEFEDCQTTLIVALLKEGKLMAGMVGDGGILYETHQGQLGAMVTHWKTDSRVFPISCKRAWRFYASQDEEDGVRCALAASDGVFDGLVGVRDDSIQISFERVDRLFALDSCPESSRQRLLNHLIEKIPGYDDKSIALLWE